MPIESAVKGEGGEAAKVTWAKSVRRFCLKVAHFSRCDDDDDDDEEYKKKTKKMYGMKEILYSAFY